MKEKNTYIRNYKKEEDYYKLKKYIENNFLLDEKYLDSGSYEQKYIGIEDNALIRISLDFGRWSMNSVFKSKIIVEKVGNIKNIPSIETLLLKEGFKKEPQKK